MNFSFLFDFVVDYKSIRRFYLEVTNFKVQGMPCKVFLTGLVPGKELKQIA